MFGYGVEALIRGTDMSESCEFPLAAFLIVQLVLILAIQIIAPLLLLAYSSILSPTISLALFFFQWVWLVLGWVWAFGPSSCDDSAPYYFSGAFWITVVYTVVIPLETAWYARIYLAARRARKERLQTSSAHQETLNLLHQDAVARRSAAASGGGVFASKFGSSRKPAADGGAGVGLGAGADVDGDDLPSSV